MTDFLARPWLLLAAPLIYWVLKEVLRPSNANSWASFLPPELAERLLTQGGAGEAAKAKVPLVQGHWVFLLLTALFTLTLAGVGYALKVDQLPNEQQELVIIHYLAPVVRGNTAPQRQLEASQRALIPLLNSRQQGKTALVYYAGSAHLVSPMTEDAATLRQLFSLTHPSIMPLAGHRPEAAFRLAAGLGALAVSKNSGRLDWLWLTDQLPNAVELTQLLQLKPPKAKLYLVGLEVSTAAIEKQQAAFAKQGVVLLHPNQLAGYLEVLNRPATTQAEKNKQALHFFQELSHWPLLAALTLLLWQYFEQPRFKLPFKKRPFRAHFWLLALLLGLIGSQPLEAASWQNADYQAWQAILQGEGEKAQRLAKRADLKAHAEFLLGNFTKAAELFAKWHADNLLENPLATAPEQAARLFNTGTAWLLAQQPQRALESFNQAKALQAEWFELCINRELAEIQLAEKPIPTQKVLLGLCSASQSALENASNLPNEAAANEQSSVDNLPKEVDWQPEETSACTDCTRLDPRQEKQLHQLQEDPWRLLKHRFKRELRENQP